jgi:predicted RNase H-like nuclease
MWYLRCFRVLTARFFRLFSGGVKPANIYDNIFADAKILIINYLQSGYIIAGSIPDNFLWKE